MNGLPNAVAPGLPHYPFGMFNGEIGSGRTRAFVHPEVEALSLRMCALLQNPILLPAMRGWIYGRHAELAWVQIVLSGANHPATIPETELRPETRREAGILSRGNNAKPKLDCASGLLRFVEECVGLLENLAAIRRIEATVSGGM